MIELENVYRRIHCYDNKTWCTIDVLFMFCLGAKEIDIAATLEHIRDQRINMVRSKVCNIDSC